MSPRAKQSIIAKVANEKGISEQVVEKDIWVTIVLKALFSLPSISKHIVFKGGTSLSKGYNLIGRFSEDIDFAIDRAYLGFDGTNLNNTQIEKLRRASATFSKEQLIPQLFTRLQELAIPTDEFKILIDENGQSNSDPLPIFVEYKAVVETSQYLADKVILEIGARSLMEPAEGRLIQSIVKDVYADSAFSGEQFEVSTVIPTRTFLEKIFLIHEQFQINEKTPPRNRMSRHLYDIEKLMNTDYAINALNDKDLFEHIVAHRREFNKINGIDYDKHIPSEITILPSAEVAPLWESDYAQFIQHMVVGKRLSFDELIDRLSQLQQQIRNVTW